MGRRGDRSGDSRHYFDWLEFASQDLLTARILLEQDICLSSAAFHCQQCIEKALKAYVLFRKRMHVDGHNLTWLCRQAVKIDPSFRQWMDESAFLNRYYIETRYPSDHSLPLTTQRLQKVYSMAEDMYNFICKEVYDDGELE